MRVKLHFVRLIFFLILLSGCGNVLSDYETNDIHPLSIDEKICLTLNGKQSINANIFIFICNRFYNGLIKLCNYSSASKNSWPDINAYAFNYMSGSLRVFSSMNTNKKITNLQKISLKEFNLFKRKVNLTIEKIKDFVKKNGPIVGIGAAKIG